MDVGSSIMVVLEEDSEEGRVLWDVLSAASARGPKKLFVLADPGRFDTQLGLEWTQIVPFWGR
jgi:hypothetical protein